MQKILEKQQGVYGTVGNINYSIKNSKSFDSETSITGKLEGKNVEKDDVETAVPLKYLSNFWRTLDIPLINCEVSLTLTWSENCVITSKATREANPDADLAVAGINNPTNTVFKIIRQNQTKHNNLNYLIDPTFTNMKRLYVLS